jgi:hypothetical protein
MSISTLLLILLLTFGIAVVLNRCDLRRGRSMEARPAPDPRSRMRAR